MALSRQITNLSYEAVQIIRYTLGGERVTTLSLNVTWRGGYTKYHVTFFHEIEQFYLALCRHSFFNKSPNIRPRGSKSAQKMITYCLNDAF